HCATAISPISAGVPAAEVGPESELSASIAELADALSGQQEIRFRRPRPQPAAGLFPRPGRNRRVASAPRSGAERSCEDDNGSLGTTEARPGPTWGAAGSDRAGAAPAGRR